MTHHQLKEIWKEKLWHDSKFLTGSQLGHLTIFLGRAMDAAAHGAAEAEKKEVIGEIGAELLARHSPQIVLDAYFDVANRLLENQEDEK